MQGFNMGRYVPPDLEGLTTGNAIHRKPPPGRTASGLQTVRFEMPFPIWCTSCPKPTIVGQGVRFNAEKRRVAMYHSTPVWSFTFKHTACGGVIEMRTDPRNTEYVVERGGKRRDVKGSEEGDLVGIDGRSKVPRIGDGDGILTDQEREKLRANAFANLEKTIADRAALKASTERLDELEAASARHWDDPYAANQRLRRTFRVGRKAREDTARKDGDVKARIGWAEDAELAPETEGDRRRAAMVDFGTGDGGEDGRAALSKPLFGKTGEKATRSKGKTSGLKAEKETSARKNNFASRVMDNARLSQDPFLNDLSGSNTSRGNADAKAGARLPGMKRKRDAKDSEQVNLGERGLEKGESKGLVNYDSD